MYPIVRKEVLADKIILMEVKAPRVSHSCSGTVHHCED
jgi:hypothetical protein